MSITSPVDAAIFTWKPSITITATASDLDGTVTKVEFRDGTTVLGQDTSAPYSFTWKNVPSGDPFTDGARDGQRGSRRDQRRRRHRRVRKR